MDDKANDKKYLKITDDYGKEFEYEILSAFRLAKTGKNYVVYTDGTNDENGNLNVFAAIYNPQDNSKLYPIETDEEWIEVENKLKELQEDNREGEI